MHWSLKLTAIVHATSLLVATVGGVSMIWYPNNQTTLILGQIIWSSVFIALASGFHIAVRCALKRLETPGAGSALPGRKRHLHQKPDVRRRMASGCG
jgi:hypothetical protein